MLIKKSKTILILAFTLIIFVCFSLAATAIEAPYENVSIGDVIVLSVGIYSESIGDDTSPVFDSQTQNYSEFLEYAEQHGLVEPGNTALSTPTQQGLTLLLFSIRLFLKTNTP